MKWKSVSIPEPLFKKIREFIKKYPDYGYSSTNNFVTEAARTKVQELENEKNLQQMNVIEKLQIYVKIQKEKIRETLKLIEDYKGKISYEIYNLESQKKPNQNKLDQLYEEMDLEMDKFLLTQGRGEFYLKASIRLMDLKEKYNREEKISKSDIRFLEEVYDDMKILEMKEFTLKYLNAAIL